MNHIQIKCFLEIANEKSFTKAASKLYITQPAISRYIASFEKELGLNLFDRSNKQVMLTEAGELYYDLFRKFEVEFQNIEKKTNTLNCQRSVNIRMGYMGGWSVSSFLPDALKSFSKKNTDISVSVECLEVDELIQALITNKLDVILVLDDCLNDISDINRQKVTEIQMLILYSELHELSKKENLTPYDLKDETFYIINNRRLHAKEGEIRNHCKPYGFVPHLKQVQSMESIFASVENGLGVTFFDIWGRNIHSSPFKYILLDSKHKVSMAWNKMAKSQTIQSRVDEVELYFRYQKEI
jgi:DNA-binding transcriptional LysR family regulator